MLIRGALAVCLGLLARAAAAAPLSSDCSRLWALPANAEALRKVDACSSRSGDSAPQRAAAFVVAARLRSSLGDSLGAELALRNALELVPDDAEILIALAATLRDRPETALPVARRSADAPAPPRRRAAALRQLGEILADLGERKDAEENLARSLELAGDDLDALRAMVRLKRDEPASALAYARRASRAADAAPVWCRVAAQRVAAMILVDAGDPDGATALLVRALELDPDEIRTLRQLVQLRAQRLPGRTPVPGAEPQAAPAGDPPALPDGYETLRSGFASAFAQGRLREAASFAESFSAAAATAPAWQQYDVHRLSVEMWLSLRDDAAVRGLMVLLEDRDEQAQATVRLWQRIHPEAIGGTGEGEWLSVIVHLRRQLGDAAGAGAAIERALSRRPDDHRVLSLMMDFMLSQGESGRAMAYGRRLLAAYEKAPVEELLGLYANHPYFSGRNIPKKDQLQTARRDPVLIEDARLRRESGRRAVLETMARISAALGRSKAARDYAGMLEVLPPAATLRERVDACRRSARLDSEFRDASGEAANLQRALAFAPGDTAEASEKLELDLVLVRPREALNYAECLERVSRSAAPREKEDAERRASWIKNALSAAAPVAASPPAEAEAASAEKDRLEAYRRKASAQRERKDEAGERDSLQRALALAPDDAGLLLSLIELERGRPRAALPYAERLEKSLEKSAAPARAEACRRTARIQNELGDENGAASSLGRALSLAPEDTGALGELIELELRRGRPKEALTFADRLVAALKSAPAGERAGAYRLQARARLGLGDAEGAVKSLRLALAAAPGDVEISALLLAALKGKPSEALELISAHRPTDTNRQAEWLALRGLAQALDRHESEARKDLAAAVDLDAQAACYSPIFWIDRAGLAPAYFDACLARFPADAALSLDRGIARYGAGRAEDALADFRRALELKPDYAEAALSLASALAAQNRPEEALREADKAADSAKHRQGPILAQIRELQKRLREAKAGDSHH